MIDSEQIREIENNLINNTMKLIWKIFKTILLIVFIHLITVVAFFRHLSAYQTQPILLIIILLVVSLRVYQVFKKKNKKNNYGNSLQNRINLSLVKLPTQRDREDNRKSNAI